MTQQEYRDELSFLRGIEQTLLRSIVLHSLGIKSSLYDTKRLVVARAEMRAQVRQVWQDRNKLVRWFNGSRIGNPPPITPVWKLVNPTPTLS